MASALSQFAGASFDASFANIAAIAALVCITIALFGRPRKTSGASSGFRSVAGFAGVLLLFWVYGIYLPKAAHSKHATLSHDAQTNQSAESRSPQPEQGLVSWRLQALSSAAQAAAQNSPLSAHEQQTTAVEGRQSATDGFDVNSARRSGYSDNEILSYLAQTRNFDADGAQQAGYSKSAIIDYLAGIQSPRSATQMVAEDLFSGKWKNTDPKAASILFLKLEARAGEITVRAWGTCLPQQANQGAAGDAPPQYCDWGTGHGVVRDGAAAISWQQGPVLRSMKIFPDGGSLRVLLDSTHPGHPPQHTEAHFAKSL